MDDLMNQILTTKNTLAVSESRRTINFLFEKLADRRFAVPFTTAIALMLLLTAGLACISGGGYIDALLTSVIVIALIALSLKVMFIPVENKHE